MGVSGGLGGVRAASRRLKAGCVPPRARGGDGAVENCRFRKRGSRRKKNTRKLAGRIKKHPNARWREQAQRISDHN